MTSGEEQPRVVIRDKRRIDPISGEVRAPAGEQPAGAPPGPTVGALVRWCQFVLRSVPRSVPQRSMLLLQASCCPTSYPSARAASRAAERGR